jgi:hypothetical protein
VARDHEVLTAQEHAVLQLADSGLEGGPFLNAVRDLGFEGQTAYWRLLNQLIDTEKALAAYPVLVNRLRRLRAARTARRGYGRGGVQS